MKSRSFLDASITDLVSKLSTEEKITLLGAPNWWNTSAVERLNIPAIRMSDGPNVCRSLVHWKDPAFERILKGGPWIVPLCLNTSSVHSCK